jgi:hypothetical protein
LDTPVFIVNVIDAPDVGHWPQDTAQSNAHTTNMRIMDTGVLMHGTTEAVEEDLGGIQIMIGTTATTTRLFSTTLTHKARSP